MLEPGPDHPITIKPLEQKLIIRHNGSIIGETNDALELTESNYGPVLYIPLADIVPEALNPSDHSTVCPYKGDASYYDLVDGDHTHQNAVWSYKQPYPAVAAIANHVAFYPQHVEFEMI